MDPLPTQEQTTMCEIEIWVQKIVGYLRFFATGTKGSESFFSFLEEALLSHVFKTNQFQTT
jgi:hypothetical protein